MRSLHVLTVVATAAVLYAGCATGDTGTYELGDDASTVDSSDGSSGSGGGDSTAHGDGSGDGSGNGGGNDSGNADGDDSGNMGGTDSSDGDDSGNGGMDSGNGGDDSGGDTGNGGTDSGGTDAGGDGNTCVTIAEPALPSHGGTACAVGDAGSCYPHDVSGYMPSYVPSFGAKQGVCTSSDISTYYTDCLASNNCGFWGGGPACLSCLVTDMSLTTYGALIQFSGVITVNTAGCIAAAEPCNVACAQRVQADLLCDNTTCNSGSFCPVVDQTSLLAYETCEQESDTSSASCGCYGFHQASSICQNRLSGSTHPAAAECDLAASTFQELYTAVATFMCGQ